MRIKFLVPVVILFISLASVFIVCWLAFVPCTPPGYIGPQFHGPLGPDSELVSLEEAQAGRPYLRLPPGLEPKETWMSTDAVSIIFTNGVRLDVEPAASPPDWKAIVHQTPGLKLISVRGHAGMGANPGVKWTWGRKLCYPGSVSWWENGLLLTLYSGDLSRKHLLRIAETIP